MAEKNWIVFLPLIIVCLAQIGASGDNSVVSLATHQFVTKLNASMDKVQLANVIYSLLSGALMIFGGMLGIAKGFKNVFLTGVLFCFLGEVLAIVSPNIEVLTWGARVLTGLGAAFMIPSVLGIIVNLFNGVNRAFALGTIGSATGIATMIVPILAGLVMDHFGYKIAFFALAIWFLMIFILGIIFIPPIAKNSIKIDYTGTILMFVGLVSFMVGCAKISLWGLIEPLDPPFLFFGISPALPLILLGVLLVGLTLVFENYIDKKKGSALIPRSFIQTRQVRNGIYATGLIFLLFGTVFFFISAWIMIASNQSSTQTAIAAIFMAFPMTIFSTILPKKFPHLSPRSVCIASVISVLMGCALMIYSLKMGGYDKSCMYLGLALVGMGMGGLSSQSAMIVSAALNPRDAAQSAGFQGSGRNIWQAGGIALVGAVFLFSLTGFFKSHIAQSDLPPEIKTYIASLKVVNLKNTDEIQAVFKNTQNISINENNLKEVIDIYHQATLKSGRLALWVLFILVALHIPGFLGIQKTGWAKKPKAAFEKKQII